MPKFLWPFLNVFQAIYTVLWSAGWILAALVVRVVTGDSRIPLAMAHRYWAPGLLWKSVMRLKVKGLENVDFSRPHFFAANHQSFLDIAVLYAVLPVPLLFVLKKELVRVPFLGWYVSAMEMILVDRHKRRQSLEALEQCRQRIAKGRSILLFPEGTRSRDGSIGPLKPGIFVPTIESGASIVPVAIKGPGKILPAGGFRIRPGTIGVSIGRPVETAGLTVDDRKELAERVRAQIVELWEGLEDEGGTV
jgi:1-acyl-sn-glycerol-3-phosphate acyltransferase